MNPKILEEHKLLMDERNAGKYAAINMGDVIKADLRYWKKKLDVFENLGHTDGIKICNTMLDHYLDKYNREQNSLKNSK